MSKAKQPEATKSLTLFGMSEEMLAEIFLVSKVKLVVDDSVTGVQVTAKPSDEPKCPRCWRHGYGVGSDDDYPELCARCAVVYKDLVKKGLVEA